MVQAEIELVKSASDWNATVATMQPNVYASHKYIECFTGKFEQNPELTEHFCGSPFLIRYRDPGGEIAYPLLKKKTPFSDQHFDVFSPYGAPGILWSGNPDWKKFDEKKKQLFNENGVVSEFCRMHPVINQTMALDGFRQQNPVVLIDLQRPMKDIISDSKKTCRYAIRKFKYSGAKTFDSWDASMVKAFHTLYIDTMHRRKASNKYMFPVDFFYLMKRNLGSAMHFRFVEYHDEIIAGSIFLMDDDYMNYYLSANNMLFKTVAAGHAMIWNAINYGFQKGKKWVFLGGGYENNDSVFWFKRSFSKTTVPMPSMANIYDQKTYNSFCEKAHVGLTTTSFVPAYKSKMFRVVTSGV